jgi:hypothetical protein
MTPVVFGQEESKWTIFAKVVVNILPLLSCNFYDRITQFL